MKNIRAGFTVFEVVIVLAVVAVITAAAVPRVLEHFVYGGDQTIDDANEIAHLFETGRQYAIANRGNDNWGIHVVDNGTTDCGSASSVDCIVLYKGKNFSSRDTSYDTTVLLSVNNYLGSYDVSDMYFNRFSGYLMNTAGLPAYPLARYTFERSTTTDVSGNGNDGIDSGGTSDESGICSRSTDCIQGNDSYIDIPDTLLGSQNTTGLTYAMEVYYRSIDSDYALIGGAPNDTYDYFASGGLWLNNGVPTMTCYDGATYQHAVLSTSLEMEAFHHIAGTYDPSDDSLKLYVDGDLASTATCTSITEDMTESYIGQNAKSSDRMKFTTVSVDDVVVYDRPLAARDIQALAAYSRSTTTERYLPSRIVISNGTDYAMVEAHPDGMARVVPTVHYDTTEYFREF